MCFAMSTSVLRIVNQCVSHCQPVPKASGLQSCFFGFASYFTHLHTVRFLKDRVLRTVNRCETSFTMGGGYIMPSPAAATA